MSKTTSIILAILIIGGMIYYVNRDSMSATGDTQKISAKSVVENSEIKNDIQYVTINAKGGYSPRNSLAKAGIPTKLIVKTNGTYDCSSSLIVRSVNYRGILPPTGETTIDLGIPKIGDSVQGVCGMGMYSFVVKFG